ncbi:MAG: stalk domain-containing protein [Bacillota bacterium]
MSGKIRITLLAIMLYLIFPAHSQAAGVPPGSSGGAAVVVDGVHMDSIWQTRAESPDSFVPVADFARSTGALYSFYPGTGGIVIVKGEQVLELYMDRRGAWLNGSGITLKQPPRTVDGVVYIPLGSTAAALGYTVSFDREANTFYLTQNTPGKPDYRNNPAVSNPMELLPAESEFITAGSGAKKSDKTGDIALKGDMDGDGVDEYAALYRKNNGKYGVLLYRSENGQYIKIWAREEDFPPSLLDLKDLNGGGCDLLVAWDFGEPLGYYLEIFTIKGGATELLYSSIYHRLELGDFDGDGACEFAIWQKDAGDTYSTSVFEWNGSMFAPQEYHPQYYAGVIKYYQNTSFNTGQKRASLYYLAEAFLRSKEFGQALQAVEEGLRHNPGHIPNSDFYKLKGLALVGLERFDEALLYLQKSLEGIPGPVWPETRFALSRCYMETGNHARGLLELIRSLNEGNNWQGFESAREAMKAETGLQKL